ncbi:6,7-dimethyl-8-ribityllumazine synthase [Rhizoclosmatium globosum]|uniref:6,7-dimethyl-8-ribityllumazine synthase n=1 Tax=Rhizoclosmatium globosum TaxID=329046 RepID=A0A1Y2D0I7_9FUNG|nr:6,7-dimethyl-8-ribityllumazine synthase [Rhizoclosmatium globosum]|eukprot:ORY52115.1 6,7-dimethyl-8-ribityllumazine synthase [Rhizoclosmatium globosum]
MAGHKGLTLAAEKPNGTGLKVLIVRARWNAEIVESLTSAAVARLTSLGVSSDDVDVHFVSGAFELPFATKALLAKKRYDVAISIGVLIKGDTMHFEYIADASTQGLMRVGLDTGIPVIFGILTCLTEEQALLRSGIGGADKKTGHNHGEDWGQAAVEMALLNNH